MNAAQLVHAITEKVTERILSGIQQLPQLKWIDSQIESENQCTWNSQMMPYAQQIAEIARNHHGLELTPDQVIACICNDCGDRPALNFAYSLVNDRRHMTRWADSFFG
jgi:hypothetical protein